MFLKATYNKVGMVHCIYVGATCLDIQNTFVFLSLKFGYTLANSVEADKIPHYAAFYLSLQSFPKFWGLPSTKG